MTESDWLKGMDAESMLYSVIDRVSERKLWLFTCEYIRRVPDAAHLLAAIELTERYVDGLATREDFVSAWETGWGVSVNDTNLDARELARGAGCEHSTAVGQAALLHELFGNPFRTVVAEPGWLTATVISLAQAIYYERAFDRMPILADALEDAGCDNREMLDHCRGPGPHVLGCWIVDLLLRKE